MAGMTLSVAAKTDFYADIDTGANQTYAETEMKLAEVTVPVSINDQTAAVLLFAESCVGKYPELGAGYIISSIRKNGTTLRYIDWYEGMPDFTQARLFYVDVPGPGIHTYEFWSGPSPTYAVDYNTPTLLAVRFGKKL